MKLQFKNIIIYTWLVSLTVLFVTIANAESLITFVTPKYITVTKKTYFYGKVEPIKKVFIKPAVSGEIVSIKPKDNEYVKKGSILFEIGGEVINTKINMLKNKINITKEKLKIASKLYKFKQLSFSKKLIKKDELISAEMNFNNLKSELQLSNAKLQNIKRFLVVKSPINGIFTNRKVSIGQVVNENNILATVISNKKIRILGQIFTDNPGQLLHKKVAIKNFKGEITKILPEKTEEGMTLFYIESNDLYKYFQIGEKIKGAVTITIKKNVLMIPTDSVVYDENEIPYIFIKKKNAFKKIKIKTGLTYKNFIEVVSGIKKSDKIVEKGAYELFYKDFSKTFKVAD